MASQSIPQLITQSLTDDPQSSNEIHARLQTILGEGAPGLASVQSVLSQKGDTLGVKIRISKGIVKYVRFSENAVAIAAAAEAEVAAAAAAAPAKRSHKAKGKKPAGTPTSGGIKKPAKGGGKRSAKEKAARAAKEKAARRGGATSRADELLEQPFTAFTLFGFSQRPVLKRRSRARRRRRWRAR